MMPSLPVSCLNLLEPPAFVELFLRYPPAGFACGLDSRGIPVFYTDFDLFTTLERETRNRLLKFPFFKRWSGGFRFSTCFAGTTITEYTPLPDGIAPASLIEQILDEHAGGRSLTIIKDLPEASPLLDNTANTLAAALCAEATGRGFIVVQGQALAYVPIDFGSPDEYLGRLSRGRRKDLRRKMKTRTRLETEVLHLGDPRFSEQSRLDELYAMYLEVFEQSEIHFDLLRPEFFAALLQSRAIEGVVFCYRHDRILAGYNICLIHQSRLVDKYIGFKYPLARELNLYFISWLRNLEFALANGLHTYIAGWTDPEVKAGLGAQFTFTRHLVWVKNPLLRRLLYPLRHFFESDRHTLEGRERA
jgi:hypothetical protein